MTARKSRKVTDDTLPLSHSSLSRYQMCARAWWLEKGEGYKLGSSLPAKEGNRVHGAIEAILKDERPPNLPRHLQVMVNRAAEEVREAIANGGSYQWVERPIEWQWTIQGPKGPVTVLHMTIPDLVIVNPPEATIWNWKAGWKKVRLRKHWSDYGETEGPDSEESTQGLYESLGLSMQDPDLETFRFRLIALRSGVPTEVTYDLDDLAEFSGELEDWAYKMANDERHAPEAGEHCRLCPFSTGACDVGTRLMEHNLPKLYEGQVMLKLPPPADATPEQAAELGKMVAFLDSGVVPKLRTWVSEYADMNGPVPAGNGKVWSHNAKSKVVLSDLAAAEAILRKHGEPIEALRDKRKLGSLCRQYPELDKLVSFQPDGTWFGLKAATTATRKS